MTKKILLVSALKAEIKPFIQSSAAQLQSLGNNKNTYQGKIQNMDITLAHFGIGGSFKKNFDKFEVKDYDAAFLIGMAGGLKKNHTVGAAAFPENIISIQTKKINDVIHPSEKFLYKLKTLRPQGTMICSNKMVNKQEKSALSANIDFVDMESFAFCRTCLEKDVPFLVIKALSDNLSTEFPRLEFIKENLSEINLSKAFLYYLWHPVELVWLYRMYKNMSIAIRENVKTVSKLLQDLFLE